MNNWKKPFLSLLLSAGLLSTALPVAAAPHHPAVKVDNETVDYAAGEPILENGVTLVPLKHTLEALDAQLTYAQNDTVHAVIGGAAVTLNSKLTVIDGVTYVPVRDIGDAAGYEVRWDAQSRTVLLLSKETGETAGRGFMWEVKNGDATVYLVGSMHIADDSFYPLRSEYEQAFAEADYLGVEVDISKAPDAETEKLIADMGSYQDGTTLKDHISPATYAKIGELLKESGLEPNALDAYKPWVVETTIGMLNAAQSGYDSEIGIDLYFIEQAKEIGMPVIELESLESQLMMFDGFSAELQERTLNTTLDSIGVMDSGVDAMAEMWKSGDEAALLELTNSAAGEPEYYKGLLVDRNIEMADKIDGYLKNAAGENYFVVVGAAHYLGEHGIIKLLQDKGYTVVRK